MRGFTQFELQRFSRGNLVDGLQRRTSLAFWSRLPEHSRKMLTYIVRRGNGFVLVLEKNTHKECRMVVNIWGEKKL